jgi:hypothetical protein
MRAPQYGHNRGKHRGANPFSLPIDRVSVRRAKGRRDVVSRRPMRLPTHPASGAVTVKAISVLRRALNGHGEHESLSVQAESRAYTLKLFHKSVDILKRRGKKPRPNPVMTFDHPVIEPPRHLCAIPPRDKPQSRNDTRWYQWQQDIGRSPPSPRHNKLHMRHPGTK